MDLMSIIGFILAIFLMLFGMIVDLDAEKILDVKKLVQFFDPASVAITVGGTFSSLMIAFSGSSFKKIPKHFRIILKPAKNDPLATIDQIVEFSKEARMKGLLSLEDKLNETEDKFLRNSLMLIVDSVEPEKVQALMETELDYLEDRHSQDRSFYEKGAGYAPAFGMIGTLIGLVLMLANMDDPDSIGPSMAVALLTTMYGSILANVLFAPVANKLKIRHDEEYLCKMIVCEGVKSIQAGENPKFLGEKLTLLLPSTMKGKAGGDGDGGEDGEDGGGKKGKKPKKEKKPKK